MKNNMCKDVLLGLDIIHIIEEKVQSLAKDYWNGDPCPPEFWVSLYSDVNQSIMITINHLGNKFTEKLFPIENTDYGYESIINQMINMYNRTM